MKEVTSRRQSLDLRMHEERPTQGSTRLAVQRELQSQATQLVASLNDLALAPPAITVTGSSLFQAEAAGRQTIELTIAVSLAIDDFLAGALAIESFFRAASNEDEELLPFSAEFIGELDLGRFRDYRLALRQSPPIPSMFLLARHETDWRLAQLDRLVGLGVDFVLLHECCHLWLGHLHAEEIAGADEDGTSKLLELSEGGRSGSPLRRASELEADAVAFQCLREIVARRALADPAATIAGFSNPESIRAGEHAPAPSRTQTWRWLLTAVGVVILLIEYIESEIEGDSGTQEPSHPRAAVRLANVLAVAVIDEFSPLLTVNDDGSVEWAVDGDDEAASALIHDVATQLGAAVRDLEQVAGLYGLEALFPGAAEDSAGAGTLALISCLFQSFDPDIPPDDLALEAVGELVGYSTLRETLARHCRDYREPDLDERLGHWRGAVTDEG